MFCLRSLNLFFAISLFFSTVTRASEFSVSQTAISEKGQGSFLQELDAREKVSLSTTRLSFVSSTIQNYWTLGANIDNLKGDYSTYLVRDKEGNETPLSEIFSKSNEVLGQVNVTFQKGSNTAWVAVGTNLSEAAFPFRSFDVFYERKLNLLNFVGGKISHFTKEQPRSFFIDQQFKTQQRPGTLTYQRFQAHIRQRWSSTLETNLGVFSARRPADRPDHYGLDAKSAVKLNENVKLKAHVGFLKEKNQSLKDERGRIQANWADVEANYQVDYNWNVALGLGVVFEEEAQDSGFTTRAGTDSIALKAEYDSGDWKTQVSYVLRQSNTNFESSAFQGSLTWIF